MTFLSCHAFGETETGRQTATEIKTVRDRQAGRQQQKDRQIIDTNTDRDGKERQTDGNSEKVIEKDTERGTQTTYTETEKQDDSGRREKWGGGGG